jgi:hypothetical protein
MLLTLVSRLIAQPHYRQDEGVGSHADPFVLWHLRCPRYRSSIHGSHVSRAFTKTSSILARCHNLTGMQCVTMYHQLPLDVRLHAIHDTRSLTQGFDHFKSADQLGGGYCESAC